MARRFLLSALQARRGWAHGPGFVAVSQVSAAGFGHGRNDLPRHTQAVAPMVSGRLARHESKTRRQRPGPPAGLGAGQLPDGVELAAQAPPGDGSAPA